MSGTPQPLPDAEARRLAATCFDRNLAVSAGAGTGKTSLLVERALNAVGSGQLRVDQLAAITFTEKAAGEMRERLASGLDRLRALARDRLEPEPHREADRAWRYLTAELGASPDAVARRALDAMQELEHATVATIHSFCSDLLHAHPVEAGVDPYFVVDSGGQAQSLGRTAWETFLSRELGPDAEREKLWGRLLARVALPKVGELAHALSGFGIPEGLLDPAVPAPTARDLFAEEAARVADRVRSLLEREAGMTGTARAFFAAVLRPLEAFQERGADGLRAALLADGPLLHRFERRNKLKPNLGLLVVSPEEFKEIFKESFDLVDALRSIDDELHAVLVEALGPYAAKFREASLTQGFLGFDALLVLTRDLLRDHPEVRRELKQRYRMLLIDEFQDTDPVQYEILFLLAERVDDAATDAYAARLEPGRLFIVGDAKQSVYRFRGADYAAYRKAVERIVEQGGQSLDLTANFRGVPGVVDPVNRLFTNPAGVWKVSPSYQPDYVPIRAVREAPDDGPRVEVWSVEAGDKPTAEVRREAEGRALADEIERLVAEGICSYRQITILFRAFTNISFYLRPLRQRGIPFVIDGGREFLKRPEVLQLMATLRALSRPADAPALLALLRSPAGGVSDVELAAYAADSGIWHWRSHPDPGRFPRIADCFKRLRELDVETRHLPADAVVRRVVKRLHLLPLGGAAFEGAQRVANLQKLAAAAGELARDGRLSLDEVIEGLREGRLADIQMDRPLADDRAEAVRITSIHRMKGLENDWIIVPDLARGSRGPQSAPHEARVVEIGDERSGLALKVDGIPNAASVAGEREHALHEDAEEVRVLYVALTRAREKLVTIIGPSRSPSPWIRALERWGYDVGSRPADETLLADGQVLHRVLTPGKKRPAAAAAEPGMGRRAADAYGFAVQLARSDSIPPFESPSGLHEEREQSRAGVIPRGRLARGMRRAVGIVVHRALESWDGDHGGGLRDALPRLCRETARDVSVDEQALLDASREILEGFLASSLAGRFREVERIGREVPVILRTETGRAYRGTIDLLYREPGGDLFVADYKTDGETGESVLRERYREQLGVYADAVQAALELPAAPRAELWLLREGTRLPVASTEGRSKG